MHASWYALAALALFAGVAAPAAPAADANFPVPAGMRPQIEFWTRVYVEVDTGGGLLHDNRHLDVVYETIDFGRVESRRPRQRRVDARKAHWRAVLRGIAARGAASDADGERALRLWTQALGRVPTSRELRAAVGQLRFQLGQRDRFAAGLVRAGAYEEEVRGVFRRHGLPEDLAYLPHVESSFDTRAYSKSGAAGMWQFIRSTGRRYLDIGAVVDERLDPMASTRAAAKLLADNHSLLGNWPLAITAYNHGAAGMRRASEKVGSRDLMTIIERYRGRRFGFASRNFYAQFIAARRVARDHARHFGSLDRMEPADAEIVALPFYLDAGYLTGHLGIPTRTLSALNPALRPAVLRSDKYIPKGFALRLPRGTLGTGTDEWLASIPAAHRHDEQRMSRVHVVRRGETLGAIARLHRTSVASIVALNALANANRIYPGQKLELRGEPAPAAPVAAAPAPAPARPAASTPAEPATAAIALASAKTPAKPPSAVTLPPRPDARGLDGEWVIVEYEETLAHFADWLEVSGTRLRRLNGLSKRRGLRVGQRLRLDFSRVAPEVLLERRSAFHREREADFFARHEVSQVVEHRLKPGENLWVLSHKVYDVPAWLLLRYNPGTLAQQLAPGTPIKVPVLVSTASI